jgi:cation diffusion facilitator CzcD-associated flavoprotein CzcO
MRSNVSKHTCSFSDFPYPDPTTPSHPHVSQITEYLKAYAGEFVGLERLSLCHQVTSVRRARGQGKWRVCWQEGSKNLLGSRLFDFVVVAAGHFAEPSIPDIPGLKTFPDGKVIHSSRYQNPSAFQGKRVAVIGAGFSGAEIAADLSIHAEVFHVFPQPFYVLPRHLPLLDSAGPSPFLPMDLVLNRRTNRTSFDEVSLDVEGFAKSHKVIRAFVGDQSDIHPDLHIQEVDRPVMVSISDHYAELARSQKITIVKGKLMSVEGATLTIDSGTTISDVDYVILSTGYCSSLPFIDPGDLDTFSFQPEDTIVPLLLYRDMIHPDVPNIAFVGMYRSPFWGVIELQARYVAALFSDRLSLPSDDALRDGINRERAIRSFQPRLQFSHPDYVGLISSLARDMNIAPLIDLKWPTLVNEIVTPAQFARPSDISPRNSSWNNTSAHLLDNLATTIRHSESGTRYIAPAIFRALHGRWKLKRQITSKLQNMPSAVFAGSATFTPRLSAGSDIPLSSEIDEYLYEEEGTLILESTSTELEARRSYVYRLVEEHQAPETGAAAARKGGPHHIDVFFTKSGGAVDGFFHSIHLVKPDTLETIEKDAKPKMWRAIGEHSCIDDMYKSEYWFNFEGVRISSFRFAFDVHGPKKDYRAVSEFMRW